MIAAAIVEHIHEDSHDRSVSYAMPGNSHSKPDPYCPRGLSRVQSACAGSARG
jgi:hypothetical protein